MIIDLAKIYRGGDVESLHYGVACLANSDSILESWGDSSTSFYTRSLIKPIQAKVMLDAGLDVQDKDLAIVCASHNGGEDQILRVQDLMDKYLISEEDLKCGVFSLKRGKLPSRLHHNCSGKHSAMIAAAKINSWDLTNYADIKHPVQSLIAKELIRLTGTKNFNHAIDGCGVPTFYFSIGEMAKMFAKLVTEQDYLRIVKVMNQYPELIGGEKQIDSVIMKKYPNKFLAKVGAEGAIVIVNLESKESLLIKIIDGSSRARPHIVVSIMENLGWITKNSMGLDYNIYNSCSEAVGKIVPSL